MKENRIEAEQDHLIQQPVIEEQQVPYDDLDQMIDQQEQQDYD